MEITIVPVGKKPEVIMPIQINPHIYITHLISIFAAHEPKGYNFLGETHDFWEFIYIEKGEILITAGDKKYILKEGEMAFHQPGEFHALEILTESYAEYIVASFLSDSPAMSFFERRIMSLNGQEREMLYRSVSLGKVALPNPFVRILASSQNQYDPEKTPKGIEQVIGNLIVNMLLNLYQRNNGNHTQKRMDSYHTKQVRDKKLSSEIEKYLQENIHGILKLEDVSAELGFCVSQIQKIFRSETGQSIIDYFIELKITKAKQMIRETDENFSQIAANLGYDNVNYFSRLFKQRTGITLSEYAKSQDVT